MITRSRSWRALALPAFVAAAGQFIAADHQPARADNILAPIWTGAYLGFHGGALWSGVDTDFSTTFSATDVSGGAHAGINLGLGGIVVGVEADAGFDGADQAFSLAGGGTGTFETDWSGTIRGRVGIPVGPTLLYATAGYAWRNAIVTETTVGGGTSTDSDLTFHGVVYGAGLEAKLLPSISLRLEALRFDYSSQELSISSAAAAAQEFDPSETVVRAGMTFHLN